MIPDDARIPLPLKHEHEHSVPTVIHHPEEDLPLLARWIHHAMENQTRFWSMIALLIGVVVALSLLGNGLTFSSASTNQAWSKLELAKTPGERVEIAKEFPKTPAERWALLQAATEYYNQGFNDLPANRDAALPSLKKALELFEKVATESPIDSPQARVAAFGVARTYEARNDLEKAALQYQKVAETKPWAGTAEARQAETLARVLKTPEAINFYKDLYAFKSVEAVLPPGGIGDLKFPLPDDHPPIGGASANPKTAGEPSPLTVPPPPPTPESKPDGKTIDLIPPSSDKSKPAPALPSEVFTPPPK